MKTLKDEELSVIIFLIFFLLEILAYFVFFTLYIFLFESIFANYHFVLLKKYSYCILKKTHKS